MILVITREGDLHGERILNLLKSRKEKCLAFDFSEFPMKTKISTSVSGTNKTALLEITKHYIDSSEIKSIHYRRTTDCIFSKKVSKEEIREYILDESEHFLECLPNILTDTFWLSNPDSIRRASRKPLQLAEAKTLNFAIPETLITNSPEELRNFIQSTNMKAFVAKALFSPGIIFKGEKKEARSFYTRKLTREDILGNIENVINCPTIFQEYIEKDFELRITVVGKNVFACAIYSQKTEKTKEDWRRYDLSNTPHTSFQLPQDVEEKCLKLVEKLGLVFGCIDMIVTPRGEFIFLEINPNGQWLWIEELTGLPISEAIANTLANPPKS